jgi:hypothetical protein
MPDLQVRLRQWSYDWEHRGLVTVRMLYLMFVHLAGWMVLLARSSASKDAELPVLGVQPHGRFKIVLGARGARPRS